MSKILDYVVNNMNINNKNQELDIIDELLEKGIIFLDEKVKKWQEIETLSEFLVNLSVKDPLNDQLNELLEKYNIEKKLTGKQQYEALINFVNNSNSHSGESLRSLWPEFSGKHPVSEEMITFSKTYTDGEYEFEKLLSSLFESDKNPDDSVFLFDKIICEYIGLNTAEFFIKNYLDKKVDTLTFMYSHQLIAILSFVPQIKKYKMKDGESLEIKFFKSHPDMYMESITDAIERKKLTDWYYAENFEKKNPNINYMDDNGQGNVSVLLNRPDWFATICGDSDIISFIIADEYTRGILMLELKNRNSGLKEYLKNREKNVLIECLSKSVEGSLVEYRIMAKKLPELTERLENKDGVLDSLITGNPYVILYKKEEFFTLLKNLPLPMLLSSSPEKLLAWANGSPFYKMHSSIMDISKDYDNYFSLTLLSLDKFFPKDVDLKVCDLRVQEVRDKLCLQRNIRILNNMNYNKKAKTEENIAKFESSGLSASLLKEMELIPILVKEGVIPVDYIEERIAQEEKELLNNSLDELSEDASDLKSKRRM